METIRLMKTIRRLRDDKQFGLGAMLGIGKISLEKNGCSLSLVEANDLYAGYQGIEHDNLGAFAAIIGEEAIAKLAAVANGWIKVSRLFNYSHLAYEHRFSGAATFRLNGKIWKVEAEGTTLKACQC